MIFRFTRGVCEGLNYTRDGGGYTNVTIIKLIIIDCLETDNLDIR
jgi:hypothetical protein